LSESQQPISAGHPDRDAAVIVAPNAVSTVAHRRYREVGAARPEPKKTEKDTPMSDYSAPPDGSATSLWIRIGELREIEARKQAKARLTDARAAGREPIDDPPPDDDDG
jgi:hypothetical protein